MTSITTCFDNDQIVLFGLTSDRISVTNTTFKCDDLISCLNLLCEISDVPEVSMTCFMGSPFNKPDVIKIIYTEDEYNKRFIMIILLLCYVVITLSIPLCYYLYKIINRYMRRSDYIDI
jgi:hypothetical protein